MKQRRRIAVWGRWLLVPALAAMVVLTGTPTAQAHGRTGPVTSWIQRNAEPLQTLDPDAPLDDLSHLRHSIGGARIVGLGESTHGTAEQTVLKHRTMRFLVEEMGFRSVAWEDDWTLGIQIDEYIRTGEGDLPALVGQMSTAWHAAEVIDAIEWLRDFNAGRAGRDQVRFVGVEYYTTRPMAYFAIEDYVERTAPERLAEAQEHLDELRPDSDDMKAHLEEYLPITDKEPFIRHANDLYDLVEELPHRRGDREYEVIRHHARQIVSYYEQFSLSFYDGLPYRDARAAENLRWWHQRTGDKIVYWAASPHTADAPDQRLVVPPGPDWVFPSAGSYLRDWYGQRYLSIGFTFDHGSVTGEDGQPVTMPAPAEDWFEQPFGRVRTDQFTLDLRTPAPPPVRAWLHAPTATRGLPELGHDSYFTGGSVAEWFDVIIHRQEVSPVRPA